METKPEKQAQVVPDAVRIALKQRILHYLQWSDPSNPGVSAVQVASNLNAPIDLVEEVMSQIKGAAVTDETCVSCGKPAETWNETWDSDNMEDRVPLCSGCKTALEKEEFSTPQDKASARRAISARFEQRKLRDLEAAQAERSKVSEYIKAHPYMGALEIQTAALELGVHSTFIREVMSDMVLEAAPGLFPSAPPLKDRPIEVSFYRAPPNNDPMMHESTDDTIERLKQVDDKPLEKWHHKREKSTKEALGLVDPHHPRDASEYEWTQIDWNLEACWAGWGVMGIRVMGKRQMSLFIPLAALKRAMSVVPAEEIVEVREPEFQKLLTDELYEKYGDPAKPKDKGEFKSVCDTLAKIISRERGY